MGTMNLIVVHSSLFILLYGCGESYQNQLSCNFDDGSLCNWTSENASVTVSVRSENGYTDPGPMMGVSERGKFLQLNSFGEEENASILLTSTDIHNNNTSQGFCFSFFYYIYGGSSDVSLEMVSEANITTVWRHAGYFIDKWNHVQVYIDNVANTTQLVFLGAGVGVVAFDELTSSPGECSDVSRWCSFEGGLCGFRDAGLSATWALSSQEKSDENNETYAPYEDHSTNTQHGGYGVMSSCSAWSHAGSLLSTPLEKNGHPQCLTMWVYINGPDDQTPAFTVTVAETSEQVTRLNGTSDQWRYVYTNVKGSETDQFKLVLTGSCGEEDGVVFAVDDILLWEEPCIDTDICTFTHDLCSFTDSGNTPEMPWIVGYGRTLNPEVIHGISSDHTDGYGRYAYIDASNTNATNMKAQLILDTSNLDDAVKRLQFSYLHFGADAVYFFVYDDDMRALWQSAKPDAETWKTVDVQVDLKETQTITFEVWINGPNSFVALDDFSLTDAQITTVSSGTSGETTERSTTTSKPRTTTPELTPDNVKHIADYCLESNGNPKMVLSSTETLDSMRLVSAWGNGDQWDFYANPCTLTITVPEDHGVVMGVEYWSYREEDYSHEKSEAKSSESCNKLKVEYTGSSGSAMKESTEICTNKMQQAQDGLTANGKWTMRSYQLLSSYDHNMKIIFYDNDEDDANDNDYYITLTAARRDTACKPTEFQCIEWETSGVPHCVHRDLLCDGHVNCATVTEPFDEIFKNCLTNQTKAIFHGVDISIQPWYTGIALRYFLVLCLIISVFFMFVACYFCPKYAARRRSNQLMRQSRVSILPLPTTTNDSKAAEAQRNQQHDLPPYEATVQTPPDYKSLFLPLQVNPPVRSTTESQS